MIGLDTNVLVRYLTEDDPAQARRAAALIATAVSRRERCFIGPIVLCELAWVLRGAYDVSKADLVETLDRLMATAQFQIGDRDVVRAAIEAYRKGPADFPDYLIGALHRAEGCGRTATFDRRLKSHTAFQIVG